MEADPGELHMKTQTGMWKIIGTIGLCLLLTGFTIGCTDSNSTTKSGNGNIVPTTTDKNLPFVVEISSNITLRERKEWTGVTEYDDNGEPDRVYEMVNYTTLNIYFSFKNFGIYNLETDVHLRVIPWNYTTLEYDYNSPFLIHEDFTCFIYASVDGNYYFNTPNTVQKTYEIPDDFPEDYDIKINRMDYKPVETIIINTTQYITYQ